MPEFGSQLRVIATFCLAVERPGPVNNASRSLPPRLLAAARIAVLMQALGLFVVVGLTIPGYLDHLFHPFSCNPDQWCLDFRGIPFVIATLLLGPPALTLLVTIWLWRRPRRWPAVLPLLVDVAVIGVVLVDLIEFARTGSQEPNIVAQVLLGLVPAIVSLILVVALLRRSGWIQPTPGAVSSIR